MTDDDLIRKIAIAILDSSQDRVQQLVDEQNPDEQMSYVLTGAIYACVMMAKQFGVSPTEFCRVVRQEYRGIAAYEAQERKKRAN